MLLCAEQLAAADQIAEAAKVYRDVFAEIVRHGDSGRRLRGVLLAEKVQAADLAAAALKDAHPKLRPAAAKLVCETGCPKLLGAVLSGLSALPADSAATLLDLVDDPVALPAVLAAAKSGDEAVRTAAFGALGRIGNAASVPLLLGIAAGSSGAEQAAARQGLQRVRGAEIDAALAATAERGELPLRVEAIRTLAARSAVSAVPLLLKTAEDENEAVRIESLVALGVLADPPTLPALVKLLAAAPTAGQRAGGRKSRAGHMPAKPDRDAAAAILLAALPGPNADVALRVASCRGPGSVRPLAGSLASGSPEPGRGRAGHGRSRLDRLAGRPGRLRTCRTSHAPRRVCRTKSWRCAGWSAWRRCPAAANPRRPRNCWAKP